MYATSYGDNSSDDKITSASVRVARVLQSHFDRRGDDIRPGNVSSESHIVSSGASSRHRPIRGREAFGGEIRVEVHVDLGARRCNLRSRFPPCQAKVNACTEAVDRGIINIYLQRGLKDHLVA